MRFGNRCAVCHFYYDPCFSCLLCCEHDFAGVCACVDGYLNVLKACITYRRIYEVGSGPEEVLDLLNTGVLRQHFFGAVFQNTLTSVCGVLLLSVNVRVSTAKLFTTISLLVVFLLQLLHRSRPKPTGLLLRSVLQLCSCLALQSTPRRLAN